MLQIISTLTLILLVVFGTLSFAAKAIGHTFSGAMLAFIVQPFARGNVLFVLDLQRRITIDFGSTNGASTWNSDGRLAFVCTSADEFNLCLWDGISLSKVPQPYHSFVGNLAWSYDGRLAFVSNFESEYEIHVWDGTGLTTIAQSLENPNPNPVWSFDGRLAFPANSGNSQDMYVWDGTTVTNISQSEQVFEADPAWSIDGRLAFTTNRDLNQEIYVWDGSTTVNISQNAGEDYSPEWSTDGRLAFASNRAGSSEIYVWEDGVSLIKVTQNGAWSYNLGGSEVGGNQAGFIVVCVPLHLVGAAQRITLETFHRLTPHAHARTR
jgi:hypothetical protein